MIKNSAHDDVSILIAEDDDGHAELIRDHLKEAGINNSIVRFPNGLEVWNFLSQAGVGSHRESEKAYLLLLDIRMPKMDGVEVLRRIKSDSRLHSIPVIILTTTNDPREIRECYELGCNCYITKPVHYSRFAEAINRLGLFINIIQVTPVNG